MFLDAIVADVDERVEKLLPMANTLQEQARQMGPVRSLKEALGGDKLAIIAECKQRSPSKGWLTHSYDPAVQAQGYERWGAKAISVLTEPHYFEGDLSHLRAVRKQVSIPILRKDFIRHPVQLYEARANGADAALLIVRILDDPQLRDLYEAACAIGLEALVEIHTPLELERAMRINPDIIGVNNRDLDSFATRLEFSREMAEELPLGVIRVCESGITLKEDLQRVQSWGYQAVLVGESLMRGGTLLEEWNDGHQG